MGITGREPTRTQRSGRRKRYGWGLVWLCPQPALRPWASHSISLGLSFYFCETVAREAVSPVAVTPRPLVQGLVLTRPGAPEKPRSGRMGASRATGHHSKQSGDAEASMSLPRLSGVARTTESPPRAPPGCRPAGMHPILSSHRRPHSSTFSQASDRMAFATLTVRLKAWARWQGRVTGRTASRSPQPSSSAPL